MRNPQSSTGNNEGLSIRFCCPGLLGCNTCCKLLRIRELLLAMILLPVVVNRDFCRNKNDADADYCKYHQYDTHDMFKVI